MKDASIKMGIPIYEAGDNQFAKDLYEQILHSGIFMNTIKAADEVLLNMQNGTLSITNSNIELRAFKHKDFLTHQLEFDYDATSINQDWLNFLEEILPDVDSRTTLQQALGSLLLRGIKLEKVILLYGSGANGKSVIFEVLNGLLGEEAMSQYDLNSLTDSKGYHRANIKDKIINFASDIDLSKIDAGMFKKLASGEPVECRQIYKAPFIMTNYAKLIFNLNDISNAKIEYTHGFFRRFLFIPFNVTIPKNKQDKNIHKKLLENKAGILNWLLDGAREVVKNGEIFESQESQDFVLKFQKEPTSLEKFLLSYNVVHDRVSEVSSSALYETYMQMCLESETKPISQIGFSRQLETKTFEKSRKSEGVHWHVSYTPPPTAVTIQAEIV